MTKEMMIEEAINWQEAFKKTYGNFPPEAAKACDMAIKALQEMKHEKHEKWKYVVNEKPTSSKHVIVAFDFSDISHYGYYLEPKDKWYTDWTCTNENRKHGWKCLKFQITLDVVTVVVVKSK